MSNTDKFDFAAWLDTKPADGEYNFADSCGECLMGQYMSSKGERWNFPRYQEYVDRVLGGTHAVLSEQPQTFGSARQRLKQLLDA